MAGEDMIMIRQEDLRRLHVIQNVLEGIIKQVDAAEILSLSRRQIRRIVKRIRSEGSRGIIHRLRGRPSNRRVSDKIKERAHHPLPDTVQGHRGSSVAYPSNKRAANCIVDGENETQTARYDRVIAQGCERPAKGKEKGPDSSG